MLRAIGRLIVVPLGFIAGSGVAIAVLLSLGLERATQALGGRPELDAGRVEKIIDLALGALNIVGAMTIVPALLLVIVGEVARLRSLLFYVLGGGLALGVMPLLARTGTLDGGGAAMAQAWPIFATAGFAGGFAYWLLAGRNA